MKTAGPTVLVNLSRVPKLPFSVGTPQYARACVQLVLRRTPAGGAGEFATATTEKRFLPSGAATPYAGTEEPPRMRSFFSSPVPRVQLLSELFDMINSPTFSANMLVTLAPSASVAVRKMSY